ncbi:hypothetical protein KI387_008154, partial [Taxus chinensis]
MINPPSSATQKWVLTVTDYFTRWKKSFTLKESIESIIHDFIEGIVTRFGIPQTIISDNAKSFFGTKINDWALNLRNLSEDLFPTITPKEM